MSTLITNKTRLSLAMCTSLTAFFAICAEAEQYALEEVVVTAQKRVQSLQDVPLSISAINEAALERIGAESFEDYARIVPGLAFDNSGSNQLAMKSGFVPVIRGINLGGVSPTTAFYIDETPIQPQEFERSGIPNPGIFDVERIEVLRGPQGTLYGSSSMGGTIKVVTNKPKFDTIEAKVEGELMSVAGGDLGHALNGMMNIPLVDDTLALRVVGSYREDPGYIDLVAADTLANEASKLSPSVVHPDANSVETTAGRAALAWQVSEDLELTFTVSGQKMNEGASGYVANEQFVEDDESSLIFPEADEIWNRGTSSFQMSGLLVNYDLGWGVLTSSTSKVDFEFSGDTSISAFSVLLGGEEPFGIPFSTTGDEDQIVHETRVKSSFEGPVNFVVGAFYRDQEQHLAQSSQSDALGDLIGIDLVFLKPSEVESVTEQAIFGNITWDVTDHLQLDVGARWFDYDRKRDSGESEGLLGFDRRVTSANDKGVSPSATVNYQVSEDHMVYARAANGFRPGFGFGTVFPLACNEALEQFGLTSDAAVGDVEPDELWNYEMGFKTSWADNRLIVNSSFYFIDWQDPQLTIPLGSGCGFVLQYNASALESKGFELEVQALPIENLELQLSVGYTDAYLSEDVPSEGFPGKKGDKIPLVNKWTVAASGQLFFELGDVGRGYLYGIYTYRSGAPFGFGGGSGIYEEKPGISQLDFRLGVESSDWDAAIYVKNSLNTIKRSFCSPNGEPIPYGTGVCINTPRQIGVSISRSFN